jgi:hypothetical protein
LYNPDDSLGTVASNEPITSDWNLQVYPNPANLSIRVSVASGNATDPYAIWQLQMSDLTGRIVLEQKFTQNTMLAVGNLPSGMYQLSLCSAQARLQRKVLIINPH